ncbi:MAG: hypothetical protein C9356_15550 [Oleiphilus sp.]|nr:MAG: hypothetical protein C9356_15550 [Oleiphilus sp.]
MNRIFIVSSVVGAFLAFYALYPEKIVSSKTGARALSGPAPDGVSSVFHADESELARSTGYQASLYTERKGLAKVAGREVEVAGHRLSKNASHIDLDALFVSRLKPIFEFGFTLETDSIVALEIFVAQLPMSLADEDLQKLKEVIGHHVVDEVAKPLTDLVLNLYGLRLAEDALHAELGPPDSMEEMAGFQRQLQGLRVSFLGQELAETLYGSDKAAPEGEQTLVLPDPESDPLGHRIARLTEEGLSATEIAQALADEFGVAVADNYLELYAIEDHWKTRYAAFLEQKNVITSAGLDAREKQRQIDLLLQEHYLPQELQAARRYDEAMSAAN